MDSSSVDKYFHSVIGSVDLLFEKQYLGQLVIIIYSTIDACGLLDAPDNITSASGKTFKAWVDKYLLPDSQIDCSSDDLWGARCGVLHAYRSESDLSKASKAREINYVFGPRGHSLVEAFIEANKDIDPGKNVGVSIDSFVMKFKKSISAFHKDLSRKLAGSEPTIQYRINQILQCYVM